MLSLSYELVKVPPFLGAVVLDFLLDQVEGVLGLVFFVKYRLEAVSEYEFEVLGKAEMNEEKSDVLLFFLNQNLGIVEDFKHSKLLQTWEVK